MPPRPHYTPLRDLATIFAGVPSRQDRGGRMTPVLGVRALTSTGHIEPAAVSDAAVLSPEVDRYRGRSGDVVVPARSTFFSAAVLPPELDGVVLNATVVAIRCGRDLHPRLLAAYLRHPAGLAAVTEITQSGSVQMNITVSGLGQLLVPVPPISVQHRVAEMLEAADTAHLAAVRSADQRRHLALEAAFQAMTGAAH